jgi:hypothetical protein
MMERETSVESGGQAMKISKRCLALAGLLFLILLAANAGAVPVPTGSGSVTDRKGYIPYRKHVALQGKAVGILVSDPQPILAAEGRSGPKNQICFARDGASYRWIYVPVEQNATIGGLTLPVGDGGEKVKFDKLSMANLPTLKQWGIDTPYALVEVEVNGGRGSPVSDGFVATKMRRLDGSADFPFKLDDVISDLRKRYDDYLRDQARQLDEGMEKAAAAAIKDKKSTGPRERTDLMFVTWLPEAQRVRVHFRTQVADGDYKYVNGINVELSAPQAVPPKRPGNATVPLPNGLRYGKQFGIELGMAYEIGKTGKVEKTMTLALETFQRDLQQPTIFNRRGVARTMAVPIRP